ncbi:sporulation related protein [Albidovulum inexpectatum]|uniref:Sporulation related protein n=1 Tax=Albidovulum inexpectatum TaxID=196587 RepID=A0A2S5JET1_9RHOB|nr:SPOR domain-containing protein [Albidovulum inexpectatum]PPB80007.1 sporulation related protein [Albidovulum inexpectatum]
MADWNFDEFDAYGLDEPDGQGGNSRLSRLVNTAGAITSAALIVGLGMWAYNLAMRDVRGIPVIQALEGPARVAPDDPGGELAVHQGLAVNEIAAQGIAGAPADELFLAPGPADLAEEDLPMGDLQASLAQPATELPAQPPIIAPEPDFTQPVPERAARPDPLPDGPADPIMEPPISASSAEVMPETVPGVAQSPRPLARPVGLAMAASGSDAVDDVETDPFAAAAEAALMEALASDSAGAVEVAPLALAPGTQLVQIGAFPDESLARLAWDSAAARLGGLMNGKRRVIEPTESGGRALYRLRVEGFADLEDARQFCAAVRARNGECVPVKVRE